MTEPQKVADVGDFVASVKELCESARILENLFEVTGDALAKCGLLPASQAAVIRLNKAIDKIGL